MRNEVLAETMDKGAGYSEKWDQSDCQDDQFLNATNHTVPSNGTYKLMWWGSSWYGYHLVTISLSYCGRIRFTVLWKYCTSINFHILINHQSFIILDKLTLRSNSSDVLNFISYFVFSPVAILSQKYYSLSSKIFFLISQQKIYTRTEMRRKIHNFLHEIWKYFKVLAQLFPVIKLYYNTSEI